MVKKYVYGNPFETEAVVTDISPETDAPAYGTVSVNDDGSFSYTYKLAAKDRVYGLGENVRGINKRLNIHPQAKRTTTSTKPKD